MTDKKKHLYYLNELSDYKVDSDDPDVRGWPVKDVDNRVIGKVDNLLVSKERKRVVYLDVEVDSSIIDANHDPYGKPAEDNIHEFINKEGQNHLIIPIGLARLNTSEKYVYSDRINHRTFAETKRMEKGYDVTREYEVAVLESYNRDLEDTGPRKHESAEAIENRKKELDDYERSRHVDEDQIYDENTEAARRKGRVVDDDAFYDRGEFDRDKYRK
ncbi:photosystem reaction center subunit H [Salinimicrobium gaetbulicola]|uniref:Photosystem reaction center subunit H n=1 Tax=Salinimicrobium gaetbulicola TaxID=999702 RepID=A0ABW3IBH6_9FLAO